MLVGTDLPQTDVLRSVDRVVTRGIAVEPWLGNTRVDDRCTPRRPVLYLVAPNARPPRWLGVLEDWVRLPADPADIDIRADLLLARTAHLGAVPVNVDEEILRFGRKIVVLSPLEARLMDVLLRRGGEVVTRDEATRVMWPNGSPPDPRALDNRLLTLRKRIAHLPLHIRTIRCRGLMLTWPIGQVSGRSPEGTDRCSDPGRSAPDGGNASSRS